ncbi:hypothetical protein AUJ46_04065 [Candidatus Peregrinibacteria bacterium CG1_02_54_53]|nr:MAG: hypothetical protein AUJ46_04065 [Candidatus Peregrinibacteria bacterium CG1_02_54_53]
MVTLRQAQGAASRQDRSDQSNVRDMYTESIFGLQPFRRRILSGSKALTSFVFLPATAGTGLVAAGTGRRTDYCSSLSTPEAACHQCHDVLQRESPWKLHCIRVLGFLWLLVNMFGSTRAE